MFRKSDPKADNLVHEYQAFRKKSNLILMTSLFMLMLFIAPLLQIHYWINVHRIPFLLFATVTGFFLFTTISLVVLGRNLTSHIGKFFSSYQVLSIWAVIIWFIQYTFSPLLWRWMYQTAPLTDSKIRPELDKIVKDSGITLRNIHVIQFESDAPANAFALGLWPKRRTIFLSKALLESFNLSEIKAIFLHEIDGLPFIIFFFNQWIVKIKMGCRHEKEADIFVIQTAQNPENFISALEKIHRINYLPSQWKGKSHPSLVKRISTIRQQVKASAKKDKTES